MIKIGKNRNSLPYERESEDSRLHLSLLAKEKNQEHHAEESDFLSMWEDFLPA